MVFRPVRSRIALLALGCWFLALQPWRICMKAQPSRTKKAIPYKTANIPTITIGLMLARPLSRCGSVSPWSPAAPLMGGGPSSKVLRTQHTLDSQMIRGDGLEAKAGVCV